MFTIFVILSLIWIAIRLYLMNKEIRQQEQDIKSLEHNHDEVRCKHKYTRGILDGKSKN